jgi:uncharacterized protein (DUF58 family)
VNASAKYFDPETLARIRPLGLRARTLVEGLVAGLHRSPLRGHSIEFAQHREYVPGDDTRQVDWKVYARSDKIYLKQYEDETSLICTLLLDTSESMTFRGPHAALSKLETAQLIVASLCYVILGQQDACGLGTFSDSVQEWLPPSSSATQFEDMIHIMEHASSARRSDIPNALGQAARRLTRPGLVVIISDLLSDPEQLGSILKLFKYERHDVLVIQVLDPTEVDFDLEQATKFVGLEEQPTLVADPRLVGAAYRRAMQEFLKQLSGHCRQLGFDYQLLTTERSLAETLPALLARRRGMRA